jgi:hypothetical protein
VSSFNGSGDQIQTDCYGAQQAYLSSNPQTSGNTGGSALVAAQQASGLETIQQQLAANVGTKCNAALKDCTNICTQAATAENQAAQKILQQENAGNSNPTSLVAKAAKQVCHHNLAVDATNKANQGCSALYDDIITGAGATINASTIAQAQADSVGKAVQQGPAGTNAPNVNGVQGAPAPTNSQGWWGRNEDWMLGGLGGLAVGGVAGYLIGDSGSNSNSTTSTTAAEAAASASASAGFTSSSVDCTQSTNFLNQNCVNTYVQSCQTSPTGTDCQLFTDAYCGLGNGTDAGQGIVPNGQGPGQSTAYCKTMEGWRYCQTSGRSQCPSCVEAQTLQSSVCVANPGVCVGQYSQSQLASQQANCPTDPYYTNYSSGSTTASSSSTSIIGTRASTVTTPVAGASTAAQTGFVTTSTQNPPAFGAAAGGAKGAGAGGSGGSGSSFGNFETSSTTANSLIGNGAKINAVAGSSVNGGGAAGNAASDPALAAASDYGGGYRGPAGTTPVKNLLPPYQGATSEISATYGKNLFQKSSAATRMWCLAVLCDQKL